MSLKEVANEVLRLLDTCEYRVGDRTVRFQAEQLKALEGTRLYKPEQLASLQFPTGPRPAIHVSDGTTQTVAHKLVLSGNGRVGVLNYASARNPGGGFREGAKAQEEDLCRCSGLYPCLLKCPEYYEVNREQPSLLYTDYAIFTPETPFFKTRGTGELLEEPFFVSVITAPAPNSGPFLRWHPEAVEDLRNTFLRRWCNVLRIAHDQGLKRLVLGAWGCGAFGGDPTMASSTAKQAIDTLGGGIDEIVFAIPSRGRTSKANLEVFQATFS